MFGGLRRSDGSHALRTRALAVLVLLGLATLSAPVLVPVLRWGVDLLLP